mmetsp:Transcript_151/g.262  ORF Transcript_151/g.262 Transcript_151/m.262 type:complete len:258 (-) Transcript_151:365-1138(-)
MTSISLWHMFSERLFNFFRNRVSNKMLFLDCIILFFLCFTYPTEFLTRVFCLDWSTFLIIFFFFFNNFLSSCNRISRRRSRSSRSFATCSLFFASATSLAFCTRCFASSARFAFFICNLRICSLFFNRKAYRLAKSFSCSSLFFAIISVCFLVCSIRFLYTSFKSFSRLTRFSSRTACSCATCLARRASKCLPIGKSSSFSKLVRSKSLICEDTDNRLDLPTLIELRLADPFIFFGLDDDELTLCLLVAGGVTGINS